MEKAIENTVKQESCEELLILSLLKGERPRIFKIRILSRRSGQVRFGEPGEDNSWQATFEEAKKVAKEAVARQSEDPADLQVRIQIYIKHKKDGEAYAIPMFNDRAINL